MPTAPKRPLSSYFIYLQIEKEFILQSIAGEDTDKSINENKVYLDYVPERYRKTKLSPDWYFGPGKKKSEKRKHRKLRGKIGFVELSRIIAARWAKLDVTNPEIKSFIQKIANQELEEYRRELKEYNELVKNMAPTLVNGKSKNTKRTLEGHYNYKFKEDASNKSLRWEVLANSLLLETHEVGEKQVDDIDPSFPSLLSKSKFDLNGFEYLPLKKGSIEELSLENDRELLVPQWRVTLDD